MSSQATGEAGQPRIYHVILAYEGHNRVEADSHDLQEDEGMLVLSLNGKVVAEFGRSKIESWWHE